MITIFINDQKQEISKGTSLQQFIQAQVKDIQGMAVAVNNSVVPMNNWQSHILKDGDKILLIIATQGG